MHAPLPIAFSAILILATSGAGQALNGRLEADRGEFRLHLDEGRVLERDALAGARIVMQSGERRIQVLIDAVETEDEVPGGPVVLYRFLVEDPVGRTFWNACMPDTRGRQLGLPLQNGAGVDLTCTSGAEGKCILMGYRPWDARADVPMQDLHAACVHMMRADYGGDDHPATRDGTLVDVYDRFGIQTPESVDPLPFEAAWSKDGALCVAHPRIAENVSLDELAQRYPALSGRLGSEACTEEAMRNHPNALLFNRSALTLR
ncbi:ADYC domain-containing protein [Microvirga sp. CF3062]|uniref:ADYC domain-containing protein n=1 Tax=Microvirga sp. CF3062 TaxID=3110182 RepID=UPI002E7794EF|nr:ADYC domain-containing protein [Microvirga sp. CF3062]MEE1657260.1 ADYC domain-containing protein [Microvirga sp. CF3062]